MDPVDGAVGSKAKRVSLVVPLVILPCLSTILALTAKESPVLNAVIVSITAYNESMSL